jgi:hypothetical protein
VARHDRELAHDAVDADPDDHVLAARLEVDVGRALLEGGRQQRVDEVDRRCARGEVADVVDPFLLARLVLVALPGDQLERAPVGPRDRELDLAALGDGDAEVRAEREPEVVGRREVRRVGDGEERRPVLVDRQRQRLVATRQLLGEQRDRLFLDLRRVEVDEVELVLLRQRAGDRALRREAELDDDLAEPQAGVALDLEGALQLLGG